MSDFVHLDADGNARVVDVTAKQPTVRSATARARVECSPAIVAALRDGTVPKGDALAVARIAAIMAAKRTPDLIALAHVIGVHGVEVNLEVTEVGVQILATVRTADRTGVEMEALTAAAVAGLNIIDMVKSLDKSVALRDVELIAKDGGKSGGVATSVTFDAVILAGGSARRLGGFSKPDVEIAGLPLIVSALEATRGAATTIVAGPPTRHHPHHLTVREEPAGGGPVAGLNAAVSALRAPGEPWVLVLACDTPNANDAVPALLAAATISRAHPAGVLVACEGGRRQPLVALYNTLALKTELAEMAVDGASMRELLGNLTVVEVPVPSGSTRDIDTWADVAAAQPGRNHG